VTTYLIRWNPKRVTWEVCRGSPYIAGTQASHSWSKLSDAETRSHAAEIAERDAGKTLIWNHTGENEWTGGTLADER